MVPQACFGFPKTNSIWLSCIASFGSIVSLSSRQQAMMLKVSWRFYTNCVQHAWLSFSLIAFCFSSWCCEAPRKGRKKALNLGQIGIGCIHCKGSGMDLYLYWLSIAFIFSNNEYHSSISKLICFCCPPNTESKLKGSTYFPTSINGIYNATMIIQQRHFPVCPSVSMGTLCEYNKLKGLTWVPTCLWLTIENSSPRSQLIHKIHPLLIRLLTELGVRLQRSIGYQRQRNW